MYFLSKCSLIFVPVGSAFKIMDVQKSSNVELVFVHTSHSLYIEFVIKVRRHNYAKDMRRMAFLRDKCLSKLLLVTLYTIYRSMFTCHVHVLIYNQLPLIQPKISTLVLIKKIVLRINVKPACHSSDILQLYMFSLVADKRTSSFISTLPYQLITFFH